MVALSTGAEARSLHGIKQDDYDRAQVLAQLAADLAAHARIRDAVLFKGGAILQMGHNSPRYSRDLDATAIAKQPIRKTWVEEVLETRRLGRSGGYVKTHELVVQGKRLSTKKLKCLAGSGREVDLRIEINWSEEPIRPAGEKLLVKAVNREPVELPVMDRAELRISANPISHSGRIRSPSPEFS